jgi:hypothetical protein
MHNPVCYINICKHLSWYLLMNMQNYMYWDNIFNLKSFKKWNSSALQVFLLMPTGLFLHIVTRTEWKEIKALSCHLKNICSLLACFIYLFIYLIHLFICAYIVWAIYPSYTPSTCSPPKPPFHFQAEPVLPLSLILLKRRHKHNKEDKAFLLAELRIAIQRDS